MSEKPMAPEGDAGQPVLHTRREFIRRVLLTTAYAAPAIVSLSISGVASGTPADPGSSGGTPPGQAKMTGSPMSPMSPMRMMSPMAMNEMMRMGNSGNMWK
ncbi:MAG: hypothetical protein HYZ11_18635 [Candidatus Tectomicrobia bacterium]|uniref:Uncharacterized protein n=1 Tax=Tectimicrobiota bacterium TaxID=2528274 RepID=A0A932I1I7_UNCTE|nr:hypothetical protein [Candidatus Tectomicrobia bacterium]